MMKVLTSAFWRPLTNKVLLIGAANLKTQFLVCFGRKRQNQRDRNVSPSTATRAFDNVITLYDILMTAKTNNIL